MSPETTVTIGGREFRIGATYAPKRGTGRPRKLTGYDAENWRRSLTVHTEPGSYGRQIGHLEPESWCRWAGEEVKP